jgi:hypothetical protein
MTILPDPENEAAPALGCVSIYATRARISNKQAVKLLLAPVPDGERLRFKLRHDFTAHHWDDEQQIDYWVFSNSRTVLCVSIEGIQAQEAARSRAVFAERCP